MLSVLQLRQNAGVIKKNIQKKKIKRNKIKHFKTNSVSTWSYNENQAYVCLTFY